MASDSNYSPAEEELPLREVPGGYGVPFFGAIKDRYNYFYFEGQDDFFRTRIEHYESSVFRTNMPPGPFNSSDSRVVAVLDAASFPILLDNHRVEKRNVLDGTFMPSTAFTGGHRVCAFLDTGEPQHSKLKSFFFSLLASRKDSFIPLFRATLAELFADMEDQLANGTELVNFNTLSDQMSFNFLFQLFSDGNRRPSDAGLGTTGPSRFDRWLMVQLAPLATLGFSSMILNFLEDLLLHVFPLPYFLVKSDYDNLYEAFRSSASSALDEAVCFEIDRDEACHNLVFLAGFNAYGGLKAWFPTLIKWIASAGEKVHRQLADEIRTVVKAEGGVTFSSLEKMALTKSVVYEARIEPSVPFQYGKARDDMVIHSHDARFEIKKGEMLFGYMPFATKDPRVFDDAEKFLADRFVGESGAGLLKYVLWSNGRETDDPTAENKQCPGKNLVVLVSRVFVVELFLRYDTFTVEAEKLMFSSLVKFRSLTKST